MYLSPSTYDRKFGYFGHFLGRSGDEFCRKGKEFSERKTGIYAVREAIVKS